MLRTKRKPLVNLREWGRKIRVSENARLNEKPTEESQPEGSMIFSAPVNEPPSPTYTPVFSPLEEEEDEVKPKPVWKNQVIDRYIFADGRGRKDDH